MGFELVSELTDVETIATGRSIPKGVARIPLRDGRIRLTELHWYEAHGIGKKEFKRKKYLD
jgi:hypothetical protein